MIFRDGPRSATQRRRTERTISEQRRTGFLPTNLAIMTVYLSSTRTLL